jgi:thiamine pyrophosphokinase
MLIKLPQYEVLTDRQDWGRQKKDYILIAGGRAPDPFWLRAAAAGRAVVCADRGASYCREAGLVPEAAIGDADSAGDDWQWAGGQGARILRYPADKDKTDLELALIYLKKQKDCGSLVVAGVFGGRLDHAYSALFTLSTHERGLTAPLVAADRWEALVFAGRAEKITLRFLERPQIISLLPLTGTLRADLYGCHWELTGGLLRQSRPSAISNRLLEGEMSLHFSAAAGRAAIYCCFAESAL